MNLLLLHLLAFFLSVFGWAWVWIMARPSWAARKTKTFEPSKILQSEWPEFVCVSSVSETESSQPGRRNICQSTPFLSRWANISRAIRFPRGKGAPNPTYTSPPRPFRHPRLPALPLPPSAHRLRVCAPSLPQPRAFSSIDRSASPPLPRGWSRPSS